MIKLTFFIFVCTAISTGYFEEITSSLYTPNINNYNTGSPLWPLSSYQGQRKRVKPCPRRSNRNNADEPWIPSYTSRITHPIYENTVLQPQALKSEAYTLPTSDVIIENNEQISPERRSFNADNTKLSDEDCVDQLEVDNDKLLSSANAEQTAIKIVKDCIENKEKTQKILGYGSGRRSMTDPNQSDLLDKYNSNHPQEFMPADSSLLENNNNYPLSLDSEADTLSRRDAGPQDSLGDRNANKLTIKLKDPEKGSGITERRGNNNNFSKNARVCFACSTATNPLCWEPDKRTTVKYCATEQSCVTKTFGVKNSLTIIRDCANTCQDSSVPGIEPKYKSCNLCHSDYCNGAFSINSYNLIIVLIISIAKCTF